MVEHAVVDRIVDGAHAVLLVGENQIERVIPAALLPKGAREGTWLLVRFDGDRLVHAEVDAARTQEVRERIAEKLNQLRARGSTMD